MSVDSPTVASAASGSGGTFSAGPLRAEIIDGRVRVSYSGVEIVREIDAPIRDAGWRTLPVVETSAEVRETEGGFRYLRRFGTSDGGLAGELEVEAFGTDRCAELVARITLTAVADMDVNRAGFVLLHPVAGVAGAPLEVGHPDGSVERTRFPDRVSPSQPVFDIAGLRHHIDGVEVVITLEGEVFEMEDQRNWTDASFKTYCRPLALPRPYRITAGETVRQGIRITVGGEADRRPADMAEGDACVMPRILLAHEPGLSDGPWPGADAGLAVDGLLVRVDARAPFPEIPPVAGHLTLEIVTDSDPEADIARVAAACLAAGMKPRRVVALPRGYLASHQPEGPWPEGAAPMDLVPMLRAAFPDAEVGAGSLTNFTEFNRCRPNAEAVDFVTFGTTAIVHAADDRAVLETLEALPAVFASARALAPKRDLHLGLVSIGMRSNPYGAAVADNPGGARVAMAMDDPRQRTDFGAAWAVCAAAQTARGGVSSYAPAMISGPLGLGDAAGTWPIFAAVRALAALGGRGVEVTGGPSSGIVRITARDGAGIAANLGPGPARVGDVELAPFGVAVFEGDA